MDDWVHEHEEAINAFQLLIIMQKRIEWFTHNMRAACVAFILLLFCIFFFLFVCLCVCVCCMLYGVM